MSRDSVLMVVQITLRIGNSCEKSYLGVKHPLNSVRVRPEVAPTRDCSRATKQDIQMSSLWQELMQKRGQPPTNAVLCLWLWWWLS